MLSHAQHFVTPWTVAHQAALSMGFPRQEYWRWGAVPWWSRILLAMQETRIYYLIQEDPTCLRATKPMHHNY